MRRSDRLLPTVTVRLDPAPVWGSKLHCPVPELRKGTSRTAGLVLFFVGSTVEVLAYFTRPRNFILKKRSQIRGCEIQNFIASAAQHGFDHVDSESLGLFKIDRWRKRKLVLGHFDAD
jgi:hypothetical protein